MQAARPEACALSIDDDEDCRAPQQANSGVVVVACLAACMRCVRVRVGLGPLWRIEARMVNCVAAIMRCVSALQVVDVQLCVWRV